MTGYNFWKWKYTGVIYKIDRVAKTATVVSSDRFTKVGTVKGLSDIKDPNSDEGRPFKVYRTLEAAKAEDK